MVCNFCLIGFSRGCNVTINILMMFQIQKAEIMRPYLNKFPILWVTNLKWNTESEYCKMHTQNNVWVWNDYLLNNESFEGHLTSQRLLKSCLKTLRQESFLFFCSDNQNWCAVLVSFHCNYLHHLHNFFPHCCCYFISYATLVKE